MTDPRPRADWLPHLVIWVGIAITAFPLYLTFVASTLTPPEIAQAPMTLVPGGQAEENYGTVLIKGVTERLSPPVWQMMLNSLVMALVITFGKIAVSVISAYAVAFFRFPGRMFLFWTIFITLMLPVEVRIIPTYEVVSNLGMINTYAGLTIPLIASATATLLFRQFFLTIPDELVEAAQMDGAGPLRFLWDTLIPLSKTNIAALATIMFVYAWNQYLWPLLVITDRANYGMVAVQLSDLVPDALTTGGGTPNWHYAMAGTLTVMLPPIIIVIFMQRWFVRGLINTDK